MCDHIHLYGETVNCIERYAIAIKNNCDDQEQIGSVFNKLKDQINYYCTAKAKTQAIENILSETLNEVEHADPKFLCSNFDTKIKKIKNIQDKSNNWKTILSKLVGDEEIQMVKSSQNVIDPISKIRIVDPVKNIDCGHTYEKSTVLALILKNPKTRCPIPGCSAAKYIIKKNLVPDNDLKRYLEENADESHSEETSQIVSLDDTC